MTSKTIKLFYQILKTSKMTINEQIMQKAQELADLLKEQATAQQEADKTENRAEPAQPGDAKTVQPKRISALVIVSEIDTDARKASTICAATGEGGDLKRTLRDLAKRSPELAELIHDGVCGKPGFEDILEQIIGRTKRH